MDFDYQIKVAKKMFPTSIKDNFHIAFILSPSNKLSKRGIH